MLKKIRYLFVVFAIFMFIPSSVFAAKYTGSSGEKIYLTSYGKYTIYNKTLDNVIAYCTQIEYNVPDKGDVYNIKSGWNSLSYDALVAGQIIKYGKEKYSGKDEYKNIQFALNKYFKSSGHVYYGDGNVANKIISHAETRVKGYYQYITNYLPTVSVSVAGNNTTLSNVGGQNYASELITVSGMRTDNYGGNDSSKGYTSSVPVYTISVSGSADEPTNRHTFICPTQHYGEGCGASVSFGPGHEPARASHTFYIVVVSGGTNGGTVNISVSGSNSSSYPSANMWAPKKKGSYQKLSTYVPSVPLNRITNRPLSLTYPETSKYTASLNKVDGDGNTLGGATLTLYTASDSEGKNKISDLCSIAPSEDGKNNSSCARTDLDSNDDTGYQVGKFLCYSESNEPTGYKRIATHCEKIESLISAPPKYYLQNNDNNYDVIEANDYYSYMNGKKYCISNTEDNFDATYVNSVLSSGISNNEKITEGACVVNDETMGAASDDDDNNGGTNTGSGEGSGSSSGSETPSSYSKTICVTNTGDKENSNSATPASSLVYDSTDKFCSSEHGSLSSFVQTGGNMSFTAVNSLNTVNISKKAIAGSDEIPGAKLSIFTTDSDGNCTKTLAKAKKFDYQPFVIDNSGSNDENDEQSGTGDNTSGTDTQSGDNNQGSDTDSNDDDSSDINKPTFVNVADALTWSSSYAPAIISGLNPGTYCLVEELAPVGYKRVTNNIKFSMDRDGDVKLVDDGKGAAKKTDDKIADNSDVTTSTITIFDEIIDVTVSKTSAATTKELPGATLTICGAYQDDGGQYKQELNNIGECTPVTLADGSLATWVSTNEPHIVHGLGSGAYYLMETIAPNGYSTAESILFIVKEDGTLTDKDGKSLADSKLVMKDALIKDSKTGMLGIFVIMAVFVVSCVAGVYSYLNLKKNNVNNV